MVCHECGDESAELGILPKTFAEKAAYLDKLLTQAGEYVYGQSQPGLWAA
jgi:hypothetical protein